MRQCQRTPRVWFSSFGTSLYPLCVGILVHRTSAPRQSRLVASVVCLALTRGMNPACRDTETGLYRQRVPRLVPSEAPWFIRWVHALGECQTHHRGDEPRLSWCAGTLNQNTLGSRESGTGVN
uniref:(northern house mosquito) hypothetical protein n=1 Tax=Culex pipiens TaxID=7175 RepID=A0A8D8B0Q5_CULPI